MQNVDIELDARDLNCPLPMLRVRVKKSINNLTMGQVIKILATDPGAVNDTTSFCKQTGSELLTSQEQNGEFLFMIKKLPNND